MIRIKGYTAIIVICLFYWILDSGWSFFSFDVNLKKMIFSEPASYLDTFLLKVSPYQVVSRIMVVSLFIISGLIIVEFFIKRRNAEQVRRETHASLLTVLNSIDATVSVIDMKSFEILFMNQFMIDTYGGDFTGQLCYKAFRDRHEKCIDCKHSKIIDKQKQPSGMIAWESQNPVTKAWYMNHDRAIKWVDGRIVHLQVASDITRLKKLQEEQVHAESQLRQAQKMEAIGNLAGGIAHDFNNILTTILGYTEIALRDRAEGRDTISHMQEVLKAGNRAKDLVRQILTFARQSDDIRKPVRVDGVVKEALAFLRSSIPTNIEIKSTLCSDSFVMANATELHQVIMNLCTNAAQAIGERGGLLSVTTCDLEANTDTEADTVMHPQIPKSYLEIKISDSGCGIPEEIIDSIFEPYFTTKGVGEGTGLGLALVHGIVESYNGNIKVESTLGKGTTFTIRLPSIKKETTQDSDQQEPLPEGREKVLIVDDEPSITRMIEKSLRLLGYSTTARTDSLEALELFRERPHEFDVVISDMAMPNMTGDVLATELRKIRGDIPIILCTGYSHFVDEEKAGDLGLDAFLFKPVGFADLAKTIRNVLG